MVVDRAFPALVESLLLARYGGSVKVGARQRDVLADDARRLLLNLMVFAQAAAQGQLPARVASAGRKLLAAAVEQNQNRHPAARTGILALAEFLFGEAAPIWRCLAPRLTCPWKSEGERRASADKAASARVIARRTERSQSLLALAIETAIGTRPPAPQRRAGRLVAESPQSAELLGGVHEALLGRRIAWKQGRPVLAVDNSRRRQSGSYYTPRPLVDALVNETLRPLTKRGKPLQRSAHPGPIHVIDPAMGCGRFLVAAFDWFLADREGSRKTQSLSPRATALRKRQLLDRSIHGVDVDPDSVELSRLTLWLHSGLPVGAMTGPTRNLRCADPLLSAIPPPARSTGFDAVIGNPPYGLPAEPYRSQLRKALPLTRHNADLAAAFIERSLELAADDGRIGLVLPKPLTYSYAWRHVRRLIEPRIDWICDVGRAWNDVLLEQVLVGLSSQASRAGSVRVGAVTPNGRAALPSIPRAWLRRFDVLFSSLDEAAAARLQAMQFDDASIGSLCRTFRGFPWQRLLRHQGATPVHGGRDLERWSLRSTMGYIADGAGHPRIEQFSQPKLLFQNIIAHVERPRPHVRLIGAFDAGGRITLDTVNNLIARQPGVDLKAVLALLHSEPVNWLVYTAVYNRAIRTMHFDQYFLDKIPLPRRWNDVSARLAQLADLCLAARAEINNGTERRRQSSQVDRAAQALARYERQIDALVADAYGESATSNQRDGQITAIASTRSDRAARRRSAIPRR